MADAALQEQIRQLMEEVRFLREQVQRTPPQVSGDALSKITLNVGGRLFVTSRDTLMRVEDTYLHSLVSMGIWRPDDTGAFFIDRDPTSFEHILSFLRSASEGSVIDLDDLSEREVRRLKTEWNYFSMPSCRWPLRWDSVRCGSLLKAEGRFLSLQHDHFNYQRAAIGETAMVPSFKVRVITTFAHTNLRIGFCRGASFCTSGPGSSEADRDGWFLTDIDLCELVEVKLSLVAPKTYLIVFNRHLRRGRVANCTITDVTVEEDDLLWPCVAIRKKDFVTEAVVADTKLELLS